jgi:hypothetical protein
MVWGSYPFHGKVPADLQSFYTIGKNGIEEIAKGFKARRK